MARSTAKPYRFKARPWDLEQTESTCTTCSVGCRITVQSSQNQLLRYQGVDSDPVNWGWLCDKGRFGFEAISSPDRLTTPLARQGEELVPVTWGAAIDAAAGALRAAIDTGGPGSVAVIGGARLTNEDAFAWARLAREVIGTANVDAQLGDGLDPAVFGLPAATIDDACRAATVVLLGPDLKEELPVLYLRLRDAAEKRRSRLLEISPKDTGLTRYAWRSVRYEPGGQAGVARDVLAEPEVAEQLGAGPVVVVVGRANLAEPEGWTLQALQAVLGAAPSATVLPVLRRGNVRGALTAGLTPGEGGADTSRHPPGRRPTAASALWYCWAPIRWPTSPMPGWRGGGWPARAIVIAVDTHLTASSRSAHLLLPAAAFAEKAGTTTNLEGRVTALGQKVTAPGSARADWIIAADLAAALGTDLGVATIEDLHAQLVATVPAFAPVSTEALSRSRDGVLLAPSPAGSLDGGGRPAPSARSSYDLRLVVSRTLYDAGTTVSESPSLAPLAPGAGSTSIPWISTGWERPRGRRSRCRAHGASKVLEVEADGRVPRGVAWWPFNQPGSDATDLFDPATGAIDLRVENLT